MSKATGFRLDDKPSTGELTSEISSLGLQEQMEAYAADVHRFVMRRVSNREDAADIAQQALLQAYMHLASFRGGSVRAWLLTIARHLIVDHFRTRSRLRSVALEQVVPEKDAALLVQTEAVIGAYNGRERVRSWLDSISRRLTKEEQLAVLLADIYGYRDKESAALLKLSVPSFKLLLHTARVQLRATAGQPSPSADGHAAEAAPHTPREKAVADVQRTPSRSGVATRVNASIALSLLGDLLNDLTAVLDALIIF